MFNKKSLSLAVAAAAAGLSLNALAALDVTTEGATGIGIAKETAAPGTDGTLPVGVGDTSGALDVTGLIGVGVTASDQIFIRFDWTSAKLKSTFTGGAISVGPTSQPGTTVTGGLAGESSAIFGVTATPGTGATAGFSQTASVDLSFGTAGSGLDLIGDNTDIRMRVYESQTLAIAGGAALSDQSLGGAVSLQNALSTTFSSANATAEVTTDFTKFKTGSATTGTVGQLGSFTTAFNTALLAATGLSPLTSLSDVIDQTASTVTYSGDFSFATTGTPYGVATTASSGCTAGVTAVTVDTSTLLSATSNVSVANMAPLCVTVNGTTETIPETAYDVEVVQVHGVTASNPSATTSTGSVGEIVRNGTTVEVAYLTTFSDYNQRLLINSRHPVPVNYTISFQTEDGVIAVPLDDATGTLQPNENLVLRAVDIVALTGGTRCSATVTVVAPSTNISVATTQVNLEDKSTDTVSYN